MNPQKGIVNNMIDWWNSLDMTEQIFALVAIPSTLVLLIQTVLMLFGIGDGDTDFDLDGDGGFDGDVSADDFGALHVFSIRGIAGMLCIGGWSGLVMYQAGLSLWLTVLLSVVFGVITLLLLGYVMYGVSRLQSSGNVDIKTAVGKTGTVYIPIPACRSGQGKVNVTLNETFMELEAVTAAERRLCTGETVRVTGTDDRGVLIVEPLQTDYIKGGSPS